jgi:hypothetical protein
MSNFVDARPRRTSRCWHSAVRCRSGNRTCGPYALAGYPGPPDHSVRASLARPSTSLSTALSDRALSTPPVPRQVEIALPDPGPVAASNRLSRRPEDLSLAAPQAPRTLRRPTQVPPLARTGARGGGGRGWVRAQPCRGCLRRGVAVVALRDSFRSSGAAAWLAPADLNQPLQWALRNVAKDEPGAISLFCRREMPSSGTFRTQRMPGR